MPRIGDWSVGGRSCIAGLANQRIGGTMAVDIGYVSAVGAGALSFLSPCVLPLVPPYLCYMAGVSVEDFRGGATSAAGGPAAIRGPLLAASVAFVLGFASVFVALGAGASTVGALLRQWQQPLAFVAGILIIVMGLNFLGVIRIPLLSREARFRSQGRPANAAAAYVMGLAFAFGWTPCIGPVLGPILTLAGGRDTVSEGALLLAAYSLGLGLPFLLAALFSGAFMRFLGRFRVHLGRVEKVIGGLLVIAGVLFLTGGVQRASYWLLEAFPALGTLG
jgi:cytochrome c-type biogenesis protein